MTTLRTLIALSLCAGLTGCAFEEGLNAHDFHGTVRVPQAAAPEVEDLGMLYVGMYAAVDLHLGYPSPAAAPGATIAAADTFPYGGTSIGVFTTRDARSVCLLVSGREVREDGNDWVLDFSILQSPFHEGAQIWAWLDRLTYDGGGVVDNNYDSCDRNNGYYGYYQLEVEPTEVEADGTKWAITFDDEIPFPTDIPASETSADTREFIRYQDAAGHYWQVTDIDPPNSTIVVRDLYHVGGKPAKSGPAQPLVISEASLLYFGSQFQDVLNYPGKYIRPGDWVVEDAHELDSKNDKIELSIDYEVP